MRLVVIIQCRLNSTRLPKKALLDLCGKPMIDHVIERAWQIPGVDNVVLNIPHKDTELLKRPCEVYPIENQEQDVLGSYLRIADLQQADAIMRITGDCPLLAHDASGLVVERFKSQPLAEYVANVGTVTGEQTYTLWADGWDTEVFSIDLLRRAIWGAETLGDRQHVTTWMRKNATMTSYVHAPHDYSALKCSVDTKEDFERVQKILTMQPGSFSYRMTWQAWEWAGRP